MNQIEDQTVALSKSQKQILDRFNIPQDLQNWVAQEFNEQGNPKGVGAPDFLMVLSDLLQAAETYLQSQRIKLNRVQNPTRTKKASSQEWQVLIAANEDVVKEAWLRASAFWRVIDQIVTHSKDYGITITRQHIEYALQKKNLPLVEMLKWAKPEYFEISPPFYLEKFWSGVLGCIGGIFSGFWGRIMKCKHQLTKRQILIWPFLIIGSVIEALFIGTIRGAMVGGNFGFQTGHPEFAIKLGYYAGWFNPFNEPMGSKNQQAVELKIQETLFLLAEKNKESILFYFPECSAVSSGIIRVIAP